MTTERPAPVEVPGTDPLGRLTPEEFASAAARVAAASPVGAHGGAEVLGGVLVCGAGPTGLCAAMTLARAGVPVTVLEKGAGLSAESRASTFHPPTLELLDGLGLAEEVVARGLVAPTTQFRDRRSGPVATFDLGVLAGETAYPFRVQLEQDKLCGLALERIAADGLAVDVRFGARVHGVVPAVAGSAGAAGGAADGGVTVLVGSADGFRLVTAPWVVAADGAHSAVRTSLGVELVGETYPERFLVVSVADELTEVLADLSHVNYVADPEEWLVLLRTPDHWRILFPITGPDAGAADDAVLEPAAVQQRLDSVAVLGRPWEVLAASLYVVSRRVADRMRIGRVLLAGDAAHQNSPLGGMGMNSGIQDGVSAARRLVAVLGGADESLLDDYDTNRRRVATGYVQADSHANWLVLREPDPARRAALQEELRAVAADPVRHAERMRRSAMLDAVRDSL